MAFNLVEAMAADEESAFDQPCKYGHRVGCHAVYCHNDGWKEGPRKCRRTWYTGGEERDEDCHGYEPNPDYKSPARENEPAVEVADRQARSAVVQDSSPKE